MAKLYFRYGTVGSAKTLNLLAVAHNYVQQSKRVFLIKPDLDNRFGRQVVQSRAGLSRNADLLVSHESDLDYTKLQSYDCILIDEAQFLSERVIDQLRDLTETLNVPVICYGLRTDFRTQLFNGSKRLMEVADAIEEIKTTCFYCNRKAIFNLKLLDDIPTLEGPTIELGMEEKYLPTCHHCYQAKLNMNEQAASPRAS